MSDLPKKESNINEQKDIFFAKKQYDPTEKKIDVSVKNHSSAETSNKSLVNAKFENFIYHYKWHTIAAIIAIFAIILCSVQMCSKTKYDLHILYAGSEVISTIRQEDGKSDHEKLITDTQRFISDRNNDGECNVNLMSLYLPSSEEIKEINNSGGYVNELEIRDNGEALSQYMYYGDYYICILSERLFLKWGADENNSLFEKADSYLPKDAKIAISEEDEGYRIISGTGVYLSSTPLKDYPAFSSFSEDTVIALRKNNGKPSEEYTYSQEVFKRMLSGISFE